MIEKNPSVDPLFSRHLNPLFYEAWSQYWDVIQKAEVPESQREELVKTQLNLLRFGFRNLFKPLYLKYLSPIQGKVFLITNVFADGLGDYFALLKGARVLKEAFPKLDIHIVYSHQIPLPTVALEEYLLTPEQTHPHFVKDPSEKETFEANLLGNQEMRESLALIHIALAYNTFDQPGWAEKSFYFSETGNFQGIANYLQRNWFSMGLQPFEEGMFLRGHLLPQKKVATPPIYLGYVTKTPQQQLIFFYLACLLQKHDSRDVEILFPEIPNIDEWPFNELWLFQTGISQVLAGSRVLVDTGHPSNKKAILNTKLPIPKSEFQQIIAMSEDPMGCTGDISLSECLIAGKIPFYELRKHKLGTIKSLQHMAHHLNLGAITRYLNAMELFAHHPAEIVAENLWQCIQHMEFKTQWNALRDFVQRFYCFEDSFTAHLNRHFSFIASPNLREKEENLIQGYFQGKVCGEDVIAQLEKDLKR